MVQPRHDHFVSGLAIAPDSTTQAKSERRHIRPKRDLVSLASQQIGYRSVCSADHLVALTARRKGSMGVRVAVGEIVADGVDDSLGHLSASGAIQKEGVVLIHLEFERRKLSANPVEVEIGHKSPLSCLILRTVSEFF